MIEPTFQQGQRGAIFQILHPPQGDRIRGAVIYLHPFAEEMNKARRMAALQAERLANHGFAVLLPDHFGCGDSSGEFQDASWDLLLADLAQSAAWLQGRFPEAPLILWGLRTGCLLASDLIALHGVAPARCVFWQPVAQGEVFLNQFLRLRVASSMISGQKESAQELRRSLREGNGVEVAGYCLTNAVAEPLAKTRLLPPPCPVDWIEVVADDGTGLSPGGQRLLDAWRNQGARAEAGLVAGQPFWGTQPVYEVPALLNETASRLLDAC